jgi:exodeoxyribonuclease-3
VKKGYSGTAVFSKEEPLSVRLGMGKGEEFEGEGRVITLEFPEFFFVTVYTPNAQRELTRLEYRCRWEDAFREYLTELDKVKHVVVCGDMNVAHNEIDLKNAKSNIGNAGFTYEEREKFTALLDAGFADSFRRVYPERTDAYTWWSYMFKSRERNTGWRIDYFVVSERLLPRVKDALIYADVMGSDHCPVGLILD